MGRWGVPTRNEMNVDGYYSFVKVGWEGGCILGASTLTRSGTDFGKTLISLVRMQAALELAAVKQRRKARSDTGEFASFNGFAFDKLATEQCVR